MADLDLLIYTYQTLIPSLSGIVGTTRCSGTKLIQDVSLDDLLALESNINEIASEIGGHENEFKLLFYSKVFLQINELETITKDKAEKAIHALNEVKKLNQNVDTNSSVEELISNLDSVISEASIDDLFSWAQIINSIPQSLSSHDNFLPILSIRIKSILWNLIQTDNMNGHIELAGTLAKCAAFKDIDLSDLVDIITDQCIDFIETINDTNDIEKTIGNKVEPDIPGSQVLLRILKSIEINSKESRKRIENLCGLYRVEDRIEVVEEVRLNQIGMLSDITLTDRVIYHRQINQTGAEVLIKEGKLGSGAEVAVKTYTFRDMNDLSNYTKEYEALKALSGCKKSFLHYYGHFLQDNKLHIVTELCKKTLAEDLIERKRENRPYTVDQRLTIMNDLLEGFNIMRVKKILHQDIKPANIMFNSNNVVKIIDFNVSVSINDVEASEATQNVFVQGTRNWMSPEMLKVHLGQVSGGPGRAQIKPGKSDIFSLGLVFLTLFTFDDLSGKNLEENNEALLKIVKDKVDLEGCQNLITKMLNKDPNKRPSFNKALAEMPSRTTRIN